MSSKVAELKQSLSFRSLRLMDWKESQNSSLRSFSDSETIVTSSRPPQEKVAKSKSKSETNLSLTKSKKDDHIHGILKDSVNSELFVSKFKKAEIPSELKLAKTDFKNASQVSETKILNDITNNEIIIGQGISDSSGAQTSSIFGGKNMSTSTPKNIKSTENISSTNSAAVQSSSPYPVLEGNKNSASKTELIIGEPRCLTLKKNDMDPFLTDDPSIFEPDFEDDNKSLKAKPPLPKPAGRKTDRFVGDMFIDDDEISAAKKKGLLIDREEGELTPEGPHKSSELQKAKELSSSEKNVTLEFFNKINECLRELNDKCREFYSSTTPDYSVAHLQRTMGNVDNIKRKLAFLIKSKNIEKEKEKKNEQKSRTNMRLHSERLAASNSAVGDSKRDQDNQEHFSSLKSDVEELYRQLKENREKRNPENSSRHGHRREKHGRGRPSQADLLNRKKISILEKLGTKQEIERVQSLFKRQMNFITQHVIQKKEIDKRHASKRELPRRRRRRYSSESQDEQETEKSRDKASLVNLKTLEDMEAFLDSLKKDKTLCEQYMNDQKSKVSLKFSSKREKRVVPDVINDSPAVASVKTTKDTFKQPLSKTDTVMPKPNKNLQEVESKLHSDEIKSKMSKNITSFPVVDTFTHRESSDLTKKSGTNNPPHNTRSKLELSKNTTEKETEISIKETEIHRKTRRDSETNLKTNDSMKGEIQLKEINEPQKKSHEPQNISEKRKEEDTKRKREDLSDVNCTKSENETEEKCSKKPKVAKYLAARRTSEENNYQSDSNPRDAKIKVGNAESLVKDLLSRKVVILDDNGVAVNNEFCIKVINNEVFLKKVTNKRKRRHSGRALKSQKTKNIKRNKGDQTACDKKLEEAKPKLDQKKIESALEQTPTKPKLDQKQIEPTVDRQIMPTLERTPTKPKLDRKEIEPTLERTPAKPKLDQKQIKHRLDPEPEIDPETIDSTLNEMENFLQDLRSKRKTRDDESHHPIERPSQNKEMKFLARIQAKRKAKLMACVSEGVYSTEKEAKFLKALEKKDEDAAESSDLETRKQAFLEKIRAEKDAIAEKPKSKQIDDDPLKEVKAFLDMIKEAESGNDENAKQVYVSFSLKRSDVKKLENLTTASLMTEESQKFLNSVRSKIKAKKTPTSGIGALMRKPEL